MSRLFCLLLLMFTLPLAAQPVGNGPTAANTARPGYFVYQYIPPKDPALKDIYALAKSTNILSRLREVDAIGNGLFMMPDLPIVTAECGQVNAFYHTRRKVVVVCYEMMNSLVEEARAAAKANPKLGNGDPEGFTAHFLLANLRFIVLHEVGHALIDILELPTVGREEDAVDQFAAKFMIMLMAPDAPIPEPPETTVEHYRLASLWFLGRGQGDGSYGMKAFADEHSLSEQRYFNMMCYLYGSNPARLLWVVTRAGLPEERATRCPDETAQMERSWSRLLSPHFNKALTSGARRR
ncbi:MAG: DUF4344 domain-containing metallopeptidase [Pseudomonadota bacterium]|nr:DUF4344 domain-containing metallopeptidase [Pseudomonadota bacterium]